MEICHAYGCPYEDYENAIMELAVKLDVTAHRQAAYRRRSAEH